MSEKISYNNGADSVPRQRQYNTERWADALRSIRAKSNAGMPYVKAYESVMNGWDEQEVKAFHNWVRFYQEGDHLKYKTAQMYGYEGYYLPTPVVNFKKDVNSAIAPTLVNEEIEKDNERQVVNDRKRQLDEHRKKILSRLQSTRKLFTSENGKHLAGENLGRFLDVLNDLEKQIHGLKLAGTALNSIIIRSSNVLKKERLVVSAEVIEKIADNLPGGVPAQDPNTSIPNGGAIPNNNPVLPGQPAPGEAASKANPALIQFLNRLNGEDPFENNNDVDDGEADDSVEIDEDKEDSLEVNDEEGIVIHAQTAPAATPTPPADIEVNESDKPAEVVDPKDFDSLIDAAFSNLKVSDIVKKLDELSRIFKNREIPRQLSVADMMMDKLGLSPFFPSLAEATRSALESNQYCLVRIDEIKSRLSGAMNSVGKSVHDMNADGTEKSNDDVDLMGKDTSPDDPLLNKLKDTLDSEQKKEKLKKELRKSVEDNALLEAGNKQKAQIQDISKEIEQTDKDAAKPVAAPAVPAAPPKPQTPTA